MFRDCRLKALQSAVNAAAAAGVPVFIPRGAYRTCTTVVVPRGVQVVGLARHLVQLVANDYAFGTCGGVTARRLQLLRAAVLGPGSGEEPDYDTTPPIMLFSNREARVKADSLAPVRRVGSVLFGVTLLVPLVDVQSNASHWAWHAGVSSPQRFNIYRQSWQTRRPPCGEWWGGGCSARRVDQVPWGHALARIEGEAATLRVFAFYQEDGAGNGGVTSQSPFRRKMLVNGTREAVDFYQLNGEHSASTVRQLRH